MQTKDITNALGIQRERIKYYKEHKVFVPEDPKTNKKGVYTERDFENLKRLVILTKAGLTCQDIQKVQSGEISLQEAIENRMAINQTKLERIRGSLSLSHELLYTDIKYESMPTESLLHFIKDKEDAGEIFMGVDEYYPVPLYRSLRCPYCNKEITVNLEDFLYSQSSCEKENGMGPDLVYSFDSEDNYNCPECGELVILEGWIREYPIGAYDSENINISKWEES